MSEVKLNLSQRIAQIMNDVDYVQKEQQKVNGQYRPVAWNSILSACRASMLKHGVLIIPVSGAFFCETKIVHDKEGKEKGILTTINRAWRISNVDDPTDFLIAEAYGQGYDTLDKAVYKAMTGSKKQVYIDTFGILTGDAEENPYGDVKAPTQEQREQSQAISDEQLKTLEGLLARAKIQESIVAPAYGVNLLSEIPQGRYAEVLERLNKRAQAVEAKEKEASGKAA